MGWGKSLPCRHQRQNMTHPLIRETIIDFGGIAFTLVFNIKAIAEAERILGKSLIMGLTPQMIEAPTTDEVCAMFYAAAKTRHPDISIATVEQLLNASSLADARLTMAKMRNAVLEAWMNSAVEPTETKGTNPTPGQS